LPKKVITMKLSDHLSKDVKRKLNQIKSPKNKPKSKLIKKPKPKKEEKINWYKMMDQDKRGLHRRKGGAWG
jgi:hypothetical protein